MLRGGLATAAPLWPESLGELLIEIFQTNVKMAAELKNFLLYSKEDIIERLMQAASAKVETNLKSECLISSPVKFPYS